METEIKLLMPAGARALVEDHPLFAAVEPRRTRNLSTYYDTPELALRGRGVSLRVRRSEGRHVQTVKSRDGAGDFASRSEWEWEVASDALDPGALAREPAALSAVAPDLDRVGPVFVTDVERTVRTLTLDGKTTVEVAFDEGEVRAGDRVTPLGEVELELKGGPVEPMLRLAADLAGRAALRIGPEAKSERGYALLTDALPPRLDAADLVLPKGVVLRDAFPRMLGAASRDFAADLAGAGRGDVEGIHRLRAAIRKMRTLFVLFAPHVDGPAAARFDGVLRDLGRTLGAGRDWDVFLSETLADAEADLGAEALGGLREAARDRDRDAHAAVADAVSGPLPTDLLLGLSLWTADGGWMREGTDGTDRLADLLPDLLDRLERKALKRGRHLKSLDAEALHGLRKGLKKLRYACEDVSSLFAHRPVDRYVGSVKRVLGDLGRINDAAVAAERVAELGGPERAELAGPVEALLAWNERRRAGSHRDLRRRWRKLRHADPFWS